MGYRWKPSKSKAKEFAIQMNEIYNYCLENKINCSSTSDSYYFNINNQDYRVSNHSVEVSKWHDGRKDDVIYIHASKVRLIEIHTKLLNNIKLDGKGYEI